MKLKKLKKSSDFQPVTIEITFESIGEIENLLARVNKNTNNINKGNDYKAVNNDHNLDLFRFIKSIYFKARGE